MDLSFRILLRQATDGCFTMYLTVRYCHEFGFLLKQVIVGFPDSAFLSTLLCLTTGGFLLGFDVWKANVAMEAIVALTWMMLFTVGVIVVIVAHVRTILVIVKLCDLQASDA